jgi:dipeptidyl-peptidase-3
MYSLSDREKQLGLGEKGITKYFSPNCDSSDSDVVNKYLKARNIEGMCIFSS